MAARRPFWKWRRWKSIGFCLWPPSTCIWNLKLKFKSKLDLCSGNHVVYRQTDGQTDRRTDKVNPVYPPSNFVGRGYNKLDMSMARRRLKSPQSLYSTSTHPTMVTQRSQSWFWMIDSQPFLSVSISAPTPIPQIRLFQTLAFKLQGQGHGCGQKARLYSQPSI